LEGLAQRDHCHNQENAMQAIVDDLTAKKLELEAKLAQMTEKAINAATELQKVKADLED
jgi:uncharacterized protein YfcZ (UPF0381/DUF406 family)